MVQTEENTPIIQFEGILNEKVISNLMAQIDLVKSFNHKIKNSLKLMVIELATNIITHSTENAKGSIYISRVGEDFVLESNNFLSLENKKKVYLVLEELKTITNLKNHYFYTLKNVTHEKSVSLGLLKVFKLSNRKVEIHSETVGEKIGIKIMVRVNDND